MDVAAVSAATDAVLSYVVSRIEKLKRSVSPISTSALDEIQVSRFLMCLNAAGLSVCMYIYYVQILEKSETSAMLENGKNTGTKNGSKQPIIKALHWFSSQSDHR